MRLIDADALKRTRITLEEGCSIVDAAWAVIKAVDLAPTIDPESLRKKGEWIRVTPYGTYKCSACGGLDTNCDDYYGCHDVIEQNFCPNCGADMRGNT